MPVIEKELANDEGSYRLIRIGAPEGAQSAEGLAALSFGQFAVSSPWTADAFEPVGEAPVNPTAGLGVPFAQRPGK